MLSKCLIGFYCLSLIVFNTAHSNGQILQTDRVEIPLAENEQSFDVTAAGENGVLVYRRIVSLEGDVLELSFLDTVFQSKWHGFLPIERNYIIINHFYFNGSQFLILRYKDFSKNDFLIIDLQCNEGKFIQYNIKNFIPFNPTDFHVTKKAALIGGYFNKTPVVLYYDFVSQKSKIVPGLFNEPGELTQVKTYDDDTFDILVSAKNIAHKKTIWIRNYDADGEIIKNVMLEPDGNKNLIFGRALKLNNDVQIVAGVYSTNSIEYSKGIFIASIDPFGVQRVRYYNYGDLENFFKYLKARHELRIKSRIQRRKIKGRKLRFNYRLLVHELVPYNDQFILLGEAFYPKYLYTSSSYGFFSPTRNPNPQNGQIFDGYFYTHAVVIGFSEEGKLLWDNSFEINDVKTFTLEQFVKLDEDKDRLGLLYLFNNEIRSKIIKDNSVLEGKSTDRIKLNSDKDATKKSVAEVNKLDHWYKYNFIAYGTQWISTSQPGRDVKHRVFFINKISHK